MVKLFDLCYSEYAWDSLSKWFIKQFYFTKTIVTMQKSNGKSVAFLEIRDYCPRLYTETLHYRLQIEFKNGIMVKLYSPDKMVEISIFSFESQLAKNDGSKVVRHSTVAAIMQSPYAPY